MRIIGPYSNIDPQLPLYMYLNDKAHIYPPTFTVKYEQALYTSEQKAKWTRRGRLYLGYRGKVKDVELPQTGALRETV